MYMNQRKSQHAFDSEKRASMHLIQGREQHVIDSEERHACI